MEKYVNEIESILSDELEYPFSVYNFEEDEISVFVDTYEVNYDPVGCMSDIIYAVEKEIPELENYDTECHESVVVRFRLKKD